MKVDKARLVLALIEDLAEALKPPRERAVVSVPCDLPVLEAEYWARLEDEIRVARMTCH